MSDDEIEDPAASTQMFQAFMDRPREPEPSGARAVWIALAVVALVIVAALAWFLMSG